MSGKVDPQESGPREKRTLALSPQVAAKLDAAIGLLHYSRRVPKGAAADLILGLAFGDLAQLEDAAEAAGYPQHVPAEWPGDLFPGQGGRRAADQEEPAYEFRWMTEEEAARLKAQAEAAAHPDYRP